MFSSLPVNTGIWANCHACIYWVMWQCYTWDWANCNAAWFVEPSQMWKTFLWTSKFRKRDEHAFLKMNVYVLLPCLRQECHEMLWLGVSVFIGTSYSNWRCYQQTGNVRDCPCFGRPHVMSRQQDNHIQLVHFRNRFQTASLTTHSIPGLWRISTRTVRNRLHEHSIRPWSPAVRPILLPHHRLARLAWCRQRLTFRRQDLTAILHRWVEVPSWQ